MFFSLKSVNKNKKIPEINNSCFKRYALLSSVINLALSRPPAPASAPACWSPSACLRDGTGCRGVAVLGPATLILVSWPRAQESDAGSWGWMCHRDATKCFLYRQGESSRLNKEGSPMLRLLGSTVRMNLLSVKLCRRKRKSVPVLLRHLQLQKLRAQWA